MPCSSVGESSDRWLRPEPNWKRVLHDVYRMQCARYVTFISRVAFTAVTLTVQISACGISATGFTAAISQLSFGSGPGLGAGDACGRCFAVTATEDPFSPSFTGPFQTVVVKVTDLCPVQGNEEWCGQTTSSSTNEHGEAVQYVPSSIFAYLSITRLLDIHPFVRRLF